MVYAPQVIVSAGTDTENELTVTDQLPNNDGLIMRDAGTFGQSRASCAWIPTRRDRETVMPIAGAPTIFAWTTTQAIDSLTVVIRAHVRMA
jgi:hypothetical protein